MGLGFGIQGLRVQGLGFSVQGLGFREGRAPRVLWCGGFGGLSFEGFSRAISTPT